MKKRKNHNNSKTKQNKTKRENKKCPERTLAKIGRRN